MWCSIENRTPPCSKKLSFVTQSTKTSKKDLKTCNCMYIVHVVYSWWQSPINEYNRIVLLDKLFGCGLQNSAYDVLHIDIIVLSLSKSKVCIHLIRWFGPHRKQGR